MISRKRRKVLFIIFSALIMVGLMIGVFADYNQNRVGTLVGSTPFDLGELYYNVTNDAHQVPSGYYILKIDYNHVISDNNYVMLLNQNGFYTFNGEYFNFIYDGGFVNKIKFDMSVGDSYYLYIYYADTYDVNYSSFNSDGYYVSISFYKISDDYDIDIYDNSQDAWASVVSVVTDATDSIINNDLLLLFAAAVPVISFGVGFLIRLKFRG